MITTTTTTIATAGAKSLYMWFVFGSYVQRLLLVRHQLANLENDLWAITTTLLPNNLCNGLYTQRMDTRTMMNTTTPKTTRNKRLHMVLYYMYQVVGAQTECLVCVVRNSWWSSNEVFVVYWCGFAWGGLQMQYCIQWFITTTVTITTTTTTTTTITTAGAKSLHMWLVFGS